jgi:hypothetical protein
MKKNIECNLHIGRPQGGNGPEVMTIEVTDKSSARSSTPNERI